MADPEDDEIGTYDGEKENPASLYGADLWNEAKGVCDRAHELLGSEVLGGTGDAETERVCLEIPKGLLLINQYLIGRGEFRQGPDRTRRIQARAGMDGGGSRRQGIGGPGRPQAGSSAPGEISQ
jgi:hypothetical protein